MTHAATLRASAAIGAVLFSMTVGLSGPELHSLSHHGPDSLLGALNASEDAGSNHSRHHPGMRCTCLGSCLTLTLRLPGVASVAGPQGAADHVAIRLIAALPVGRSATSHLFPLPNAPPAGG